MSLVLGICSLIISHQYQLHFVLPQLQREEAARNEAETKLSTTIEEAEESKKKYESNLQEKENEIRGLKEEVCVCVCADCVCVLCVVWTVCTCLGTVSAQCELCVCAL